MQFSYFLSKDSRFTYITFDNFIDFVHDDVLILLFHYQVIHFGDNHGFCRLSHAN